MISLETFGHEGRAFPDSYLRSAWPEALADLEAGKHLPPLDDPEVEAHLGTMPAWITDKYETLRRVCDPDDVGAQGDLPPDNMDAILKPRRNPDGMAKGVRMYDRRNRIVPSGYLWQRFYSEGRYWSVDYACDRSEVETTFAAAEGIPLGGAQLGEFAAWVVRADPPEEVPFVEIGDYTLERLFDGQADYEYTGLLNIEFRFRDGADYEEAEIIEIHFRPSISFGPIYGPAFRRRLLGFPEAHDPSVGWIPRTRPTGGVAVPETSRAEWSLRIDDHKPSWRRAMRYYQDDLDASGA